MKVCTKCERELPEDKFYKDKKNKSGLASRCKDCMNADHKNYYANNIEYEAKRAAKRYAEMQEWLAEQKNKPCADCGGSFPSVCMHFDHRPGEEKIAGVSALARTNNKQTVLEEIAKCDLVCANCHAIRTFLSERDKVGSPRKYDRTNWDN